MLQYIVKEHDKYSIPELAQMAIEGGCKWIVLHLPSASDTEIREIAQEVVPLCQEAAVILTIENHIEMAKKLGIHGVLLVDSSVSPFDAREFCGPEAIIGVQTNSAMAVVPLKTIDVDYAVFPTDMPIDAVRKNIEAVREAGIEMPIVASGSYTVEQIPMLLQAGVTGLALSSAISDAPDPVVATRKILEMLS